MAQLMVMYKKPADAVAFDTYYFQTHVPIAKTIPGLRSYQVNQGPVATPGGESPYHLVATLGFDSMAAIQQAFASPEGQKTAADLGNFAQAGAEMLMFDTRMV